MAKTQTANDDTPEDLSFLPHQERLNLKMFQALETLGRKLEQSETERQRLARRLALIESAATIDEETGRFYLPVVVEEGSAAAPEKKASARWPMAAVAVNSAVALFALGAVLFQPSTPSISLTPEQQAVLASLAGPRSFVAQDSPQWKPVSTVAAVASSELIGPPVPTVLSSHEDRQDSASSSEKPPVVTPVVETPPPKVERTVSIPRERKPSPTASAPEITPGKIASDTRLSGEMAALEQHAFENNAEAQHDLASFYAAGKDVPQDYKRAVYWFNRAAAGGIANADYNLGVMFQQGLGVRQDMAKALMWYTRAADRGHPEALYNLGIAYIQGVGAKRDPARGVAYFKRAANAGVAQAAYNLGVLYESQFLGAPDVKKAMDWYQVAVSDGHALAAEAVARLKTGTSTAATSGDALTSGAPQPQALTPADLVEPASGDSSAGEGGIHPSPSFRLNP